MAYSQGDDELEYLKDAIEVLEAASKTPARSRNTKIGPTIDEISEHAYQFGIQNAELRRIIELITRKTELDQSSVTVLIKNLFPAALVDSHIVVLVVNCLGQAKQSPSPSTQAALVRWVTAIHDVLEDQTSISRFYSVLFNMLDMMSIRTPLSQLLAITTRRKHVRPFRIQRLLELSQQTANEPALVNLLRVYKNFCPEIIIGTTSNLKTPQSSLPDPEWRQRLRAIQQAAASLSGDNINAGGFRITRSGYQSSRSAIPEVHTFHAHEVKTTLEDVQNATDLVEHLEEIETPSQLVSALRDPLLQKFLMLGGSTDSQSRLDFWLTRYFEEELENIREGFGLSATLPEIFSGLASYTETSKMLLPVVEDFLRVYLPSWNGSSDLGAILDLLSFLPPQPFLELHDVVLSPLEQSILSGAEAPFDSLFDFYGNLAQHWLSSSHVPQRSHTPGLMMSNALFDLIQHVSVLAESALATNQPAASSILDFYERIADLTAEQISRNKQNLPPILPPQPLLYSLAIAHSLSTFSRTCALLVVYKRSYEKQLPGVTRVYQVNATDVLNGYLMDICNMIWRSRALSAADSNSAGVLCPNELTGSLQSYVSSVDRDYNIPTLFDFSHNVLMAALAQIAFTTREEAAHQSTGEETTLHAGPVTQRSLIVLEKGGGMTMSWKEYRVFVMNWLEAYGIDGIKQLMFATMKDLMK